MAIRIGLGSWADDAYVGVLYPPKSPKTERLRLYAGHFDRVELNNTYYSTPSPAQMTAWARQTPGGFVFDFKLHRALAQRPAAEGVVVEKARAALASLISAKKMGCCLLTLAPSFGPAKHRLEEIDTLLSQLPAPVPLAVELRDRAWVDGAQRERTLGYFRERNLVWVALDLPKVKHASLLPPIDEVTNPRLAYVRLHGRNKQWAEAKSAAERHHHDYTTKELKEIAGRIQRLADSAKDVHVSVNNHAHDFAPKAALRLRELVG